jgi:hypothetical protein
MAKSCYCLVKLPISALALISLFFPKVANPAVWIIWTALFAMLAVGFVLSIDIILREVRITLLPATQKTLILAAVMINSV